MLNKQLRQGINLLLPSLDRKNITIKLVFNCEFNSCFFEESNLFPLILHLIHMKDLFEDEALCDVIGVINYVLVQVKVDFKPYNGWIIASISLNEISNHFVPFLLHRRLDHQIHLLFLFFALLEILFIVLTKRIKELWAIGLDFNWLDHFGIFKGEIYLLAIINENAWWSPIAYQWFRDLLIPVVEIITLILEIQRQYQQLLKGYHYFLLICSYILLVKITLTGMPKTTLLHHSSSFWLHLLIEIIVIIILQVCLIKESSSHQEDAELRRNFLKLLKIEIKVHYIGVDYLILVGEHVVDVYLDIPSMCEVPGLFEFVVIDFFWVKT